VITELTPSPAQEDVSRNTKIEVTFSVPLDAKHIKKHDIKLRCLSCKKKKKIKGLISYIEVEKKLTFTPKESMEPGLYEVEIKSLKADKAHKDTKINEIKYRFVVINEVLQSMTLHPDSIEIKEAESLQLEVMGHYDTGAEKDITAQVQWSITDSQIVTVDANATLKALKEGTTTVTARMESVDVSAEITVYKEINGHRLPPEPDKATNDATLPGVDMNGNGVRDDVERWIYERFSKDPDYPKTKVSIAMQYAKAYQYIITHNPSQSYENKTYEKADYAMDCAGYWHGKLIKKNNLHGVEITKIILSTNIFDNEFKSKMFNTRERTKAYWKFNGSLSGHMLGGGGGILSSTKDKCESDIEAFGEW